MKHISFIKQNLLLALGALTLLTTGCIREELDACKNNRLTLKVERADGEDITPQGLVEDASLYIFDENNNLLETRKLDANFINNRYEIELKNYESGKKLHFVAWGNLGNQENQTVTKAELLDQLKLSLKSANGIAQSPDSLYYGQKTVTTMDGGVAGLDTVVVRLKTGTVTIKTEGFPLYAKKQGLKSGEVVDFSLDKTLDTYDAAGAQTGNKVIYNPDGTLDTNTSEWMSVGVVDRQDAGGKRNIFSGDKMECTAFRNGVRIGSASKALNNLGEYVDISVPEAGRTDIKILFDENGVVSAKIRITPWGVVDEDIDF